MKILVVTQRPRGPGRRWDGKATGVRGHHYASKIFDGRHRIIDATREASDFCMLRLVFIDYEANARTRRGVAIASHIIVNLAEP